MVERMRKQLQRYKNLEQNQKGYRYADELSQLRLWQAQRLRGTHAALLNDHHYRQATEFVLTDVYGGIDLLAVASDIHRALPVAAKLFPENVMRTAEYALELNALTGELDETLMLMHFKELGFRTLTEESYIEAYRACDHYELREYQIELAQSLGKAIDRYVASRVIYMGFKMAQGPAYAAGLHALYDFMSRGFTVLRPLGGADKFMGKITHPERSVIQRIKASEDNPFRWAVSAR